jgi:uncharacterized protein with PQ loop repeat
VHSLPPAQDLAYVASAVGVIVVAPQIQRIVRYPSLAGVSPWTWSITVVACSLWLTYGLRSGSMPQVPGNVLLISGAVAIVLLVPARWSRQRRATALALMAASLVTISTQLSPEQVGFLAFAIGLTGMWPQVSETVWQRRGLGPSSVSLSSIALKVLSQTLWLSFALLTTDVPVVVAAVVTLTANGIVAAVEAARRRSARDLQSCDQELVSAVA